ncbi:TfoX/Sxy family protein [Bradyrhizobium sp. GCM10027634]|uniref:TfoX/Sxy family protein n=1 Tax=unclassified Bradyrhizobium TaxID=2631580 RepID=UPI00188B4C70|nr:MULTISPECIES: TfoX/Sxy family protein [unclassified Bradyrhizobium]MDN5003596.1 TfoX/Sxy family protein [Bradyrhizobium sp. WYCCWR 12677]
MAYDEGTASRVRKLLAGQRHVAEKKMMGGLCFMVDNVMCCTISGRGGMLFRVGPEAHARMLKEPHASPMEMRGRIMTGFVRVAPEGYETDADLKRWVRRGLDFVAAAPKEAKLKKTAPRKAATKTKKPTAKTAPPRARARTDPHR